MHRNLLHRKVAAAVNSLPPLYITIPRVYPHSRGGEKWLFTSVLSSISEFRDGNFSKQGSFPSFFSAFPTSFFFRWFGRGRDALWHAECTGIWSRTTPTGVNKYWVCFEGGSAACHSICGAILIDLSILGSVYSSLNAPLFGVKRVWFGSYISYLMIYFKLICNQ